jgi:hypothetical protein
MQNGKKSYGGIRTPVASLENCVGNQLGHVDRKNNETYLMLHPSLNIYRHLVHFLLKNDKHFGTEGVTLWYR